MLVVKEKALTITPKPRVHSKNFKSALEECGGCQQEAARARNAIKGEDGAQVWQ